MVRMLCVTQGDELEWGLPWCAVLCLADALVEVIVQAGAVDAVVPLLSIGEKADPVVAAR